MGNPADRILTEDLQASVNPADALLGDSGASSPLSPSPDDTPEIARIKSLLARPDIKPDQRQRLQGMLAEYSALPKPESGAQQFGETAAQAALAPAIGVSATLGHVPVLGVPFRAIAGGLGNLSQALEPNEASANPWAQYLGTVAGGAAGSIPVFKGAQVATEVLGAVATRLAPTVAARALAGIASAASELPPVLGAGLEALPKQLTAGAIFQGAVDPQSLTTPQGLAMVGAAGAFGALSEGVGRATAPPEPPVPQTTSAAMGAMTPEQVAHLNTPEGQNALASRLLATPEQNASFRAQWMDTGLPLTPQQELARHYAVTGRDALPATTGVPEAPPAPAEVADPVVGVVAPQVATATAEGQPVEPPTFGQAGRNIGLRIVTPDEHSVTEGIFTRDFWSGKAMGAYKQVVDATAPLQKFGTYVHNLARLARSYGSSAEYFISHGTLDSNFAPDGGPGLRAILAGENGILRGREEELTQYMVSARAMEVGAHKVGVDEASARIVVSNAAPEIVQAHQQIIEWGRKLTALAEAEGMLAPGTLQHFKDISQNYTYLRRMFEDPETLKGGYRSDNLGAKQLYMRFRGSDRLIVNPIVAEIVRTERVMKAIYQNRALRGWSDWVESRPSLMDEMGIKRLVDATEAKSPELLQEAKNYMENARRDGYSLNLSEAKEMALAFGNKTSHVEGNSISMWKDGRVVRYQVPHEIAQAYTSLNPMELEWWQNMMGMPARTLKGGVTLNPVFQIYNIIRDSYDATLNSQYGFKFGIDSFKGLIQAITRGDAWQEWRAGGGGFHTISTAGGKRAGNIYREILPKSYTGQVIQMAKHPIELLKTMSAPFEEATRLGEYMAAKGQGASTIEAVMAANQVTTDFKQIGMSMQGLSAMTAFLNPAIQSLDNTFKTAIRNPIGAGLKGFGAITIPTMYLWYANKDDKEINDLRKTQSGLSSWFIRMPQGGILKLPKPFLYGQIFGTAFESALDKAYAKDPAALERLGQGLWQQTAVNVFPTVLQSYISLQSNKDQFTGAPIVPLDKQDLAPGYQTQFQTGPIARAVGLRLNVSPAKIEFITRQLLGSSGSDILKTADRVVGAADPNHPALPVDTDFPFLGKLMARYPSMGVEPVRTFYDNASDAKSVMNTINYLGRERPQELEQYVLTHKEEIGLAGVYAQTRAEISRIRKSIEDLNNAPVNLISAAEKRKTIDYLLRQIIEVTRTVNADVGVAKAGMNPAITAQ